MILSCAIAVLAASGQLAAAAPRDPVRLVKTSEEDPGQWVTEQEKWELFTSRGVGFIDITDIKDERVLENLSTKPTGRISTQAAAFPTELSHVEEANELIAASGVEGTETMSDCALLDLHLCQGRKAGLRRWLRTIRVTISPKLAKKPPNGSSKPLQKLLLQTPR